MCKFFWDAAVQTVFEIYMRMPQIASTNNLRRLVTLPEFYETTALWHACSMVCGLHGTATTVQARTLVCVSDKQDTGARHFG
jgi:hypothetical protein